MALTRPPKTEALMHLIFADFSDCTYTYSVLYYVFLSILIRTKSLMVRIGLDFLSQFSGQRVGTIVVSTSKIINPECKLKGSPKHFDTFLFPPFSFGSTHVYCFCFPTFLDQIWKPIQLSYSLSIMNPGTIIWTSSYSNYLQCKLHAVWGNIHH